MCNRYTLIDPDSAFAEIARILGISLKKPEWVTKRYNLGLMQVAPSVVNVGPGVEVMPMQFGSQISGVDKVVGNARADTIFQRRTFKKQVSSHRCLIPTSGFIDWETDGVGKKWPHLFMLSHERPFAMAAIWNAGDASKAVPPHFYIVTTEPNSLVARHHDRMPLILPENRMARWLDPSPMEEPEFREMCASYPETEMCEREVSTFINNVRHEGPECLGDPSPRPANPNASKSRQRAEDSDQMGLGF